MLSPQGQVLPILGPQSESQKNMFYVPKYGGQNAPMTAGQMQPTSYMTQGQYQQHPIFNS